MDLFNTKKCRRLTAEIDTLKTDLEERNRVIGQLEDANRDLCQDIDDIKDLVELMDDELAQVALGRYRNKYLHIKDGIRDIAFRVVHATCYHGEVTLYTNELKNIMECGYGERVDYPASDSSDIAAYTTTLSHLKTVGEIIRAADFHTLH